MGHNILGSGMDFDITIKEGAGAFVCGEETALIHSIEGQRGMPRMRPPYPSVHGLWGCPTNINNVETYVASPASSCRGRDGLPGSAPPAAVEPRPSPSPVPSRTRAWSKCLLVWRCAS